MEYKPDQFVLNALPKDVSCKVFGNWFTFKAGSMKLMRAEIADFLAKEKGYLGLVTLGEQFADPEFVQSEEGQALLAAKKDEGINKRSQYLQAQVNNLKNSLINDLRAKDMNVDPNTAANYATDGDLEAMEELVGYQRLQKDASKERAEKAKLAMRKIEAANNSPVAKKD